MKVRIVAMGRRMPAWVSTGVDDYAGRLPREWGFDLLELRAEPRGQGRNVSQMLAAEAARIVPACSGYRTIALDEHGAPWTTATFVEQLRRRQAAGDDIAFIIGSADGLAADMKQSAHAVVALSAMTLPHGLARVMLVEQLYRAYSVVTGHPYHRQ